MIKLGGATDIAGQQQRSLQNQKEAVPQPVDQQQRDKQQLEALMKELQEAISRSQALEPFKDQLLLDLTQACASRSWTSRTGRCSTSAALR